MENLKSLLEQRLEPFLPPLLPSADLAAFLPLEIIQATRPKFGHYQCNCALKMAAICSENPRAIAEHLVQSWLKTNDPMIDKLEVAGAGFINIFLSTHFLSKELMSVALDPRLGVPPLKKKQRVVVEFSAPNVAKELHVGHLRSTIIGESLARLFEFLGHDVLRLNHIGDFGTQFGMLICYLKEKHPAALLKESEATLSALMQWYRESKKLFDADQSFKKRAQLEVIALQKSDPKTVAAWEKICAISREGFSEIYRLLDVELTERGESFYASLLPKIVADFEAKNLITLSDGAKCVFLEGFVNKEGNPLPMILQKSDGGYNYATTDMAALFHRLNQEKADRIVYVVDAGQRLHFQMVFQAAEKAGYYDPKKIDVQHVPFGVVLGPDGKKFKTRSGKTERLIDLLSHAVNRAKELLTERLEDATPKEIDKLAHILGIDAVKYADLSCHRIKDYVFSYDKMLKFEGNTASYLLYSYVRILGIKRKVNKELDLLALSEPIILNHPSEIALGLCLRQFGEALEAMDRDLLPNRLSDYLHGLAEKFHLFFRDCRVEGSPQESSRLALCALTAQILKQGLSLLGLEVIERM